MRRVRDILPTFIESFNDSFNIFGNSHRLDVDFTKSTDESFKDDMEKIGGDFMMIGTDLRTAMSKIPKEHLHSDGD